MAKTRILGIFDDYDSFIRALRELKEIDPERILTYTPVPYHEVEEILDERESPIRYVTLAGGLLGFGLGAWLTIYTAEAYPLIVGGKPLISIPPYLIIAFELTILLATVLTAIAYFTISPISRSGVSYDPSFSEDRFGISIESSDIGSEQLKEIMERHGAVEVRIQ